MGKKQGHKVNNSLGRIIIKDRYGKKRTVASSMLHTSEIQDGQDWDRLNIQSITEQTHIDEFLSTAELAGTEFQAVRLNMKFVNPSQRSGMPTVDEKKKIEAAQDANRNMLKIPRRPGWSILTTPEQLAEAERNNFLTWRRSLVQLQDMENITLTPFERNLEFWRQLWRVIERSDVVMQILDARNPLLFRCEDLEAYVKEVSKHKDNMLLINKSDFLTDQQRETWAEYFRQHDIKAVFFSALYGEDLDDIEEEEQDTQPSENDDEDDDDDDEGDSEDGEEEDRDNDDDDDMTEEGISKEAIEECEKDIQHLSMKLQEQNINTSSPSSSTTTTPKATTTTTTTTTSPTLVPNPTTTTTSPISSPSTSSVPNPATTTTTTTTTTSLSLPSPPSSSTSPGSSNKGYVTTSQLMNRAELMDVMRTVHTGPRVAGKVVTIGLVGYPNVGKSSTINCLMQEKKVSVSATPGKTKHFQTLYLSEDILLCDCPGLVFPAFVTTKQEMIISGILPIDQMRNEVPPINLVASRIPRKVFENMYGITIPKPREGEDPDRAPTSEELLNAYGFMRGYMTQRGLPDNPRSARYILKDYMNGKLLFCHAPPDRPQDLYHTPDVVKVGKGGTQAAPTPQQKKTQPYAIQPEVVDRRFFKLPVASYHVKAINRGPTNLTNAHTAEGKLPKAKKFKKKEKLRKRFAHLDDW
ncbi:hypothetical protein Pmani_030143 [Petrolisthes manimaculis]|uniref:Large subunit GTPase 1 homolog n=1 Tax=Petrolisthes manimaculis TaxID=1843537 RepID=A0AAE1NWM1_9EUCA|nr:hypothetical protein Pmani_030143 [Petrolisthes manimaculis]